MPNPVWPADLPQYVTLDSFKEQKLSNKISTPMEHSATVKTRRRFTAVPTKYTFSIMMTVTQKALLDDFYEDTCKGGTLPFDWVRPLEQDAVTFLFMGEPPSYSANAPQNVIATFDVQTVI